MQPLLYFDCFSGISGDMTVGALCDLGVELAEVQRELDKLSLGATRLGFERQTRHGISGLKFLVETPVAQEARAQTPCMADGPDHFERVNRSSQSHPNEPVAPNAKRTRWRRDRDEPLPRSVLPWFPDEKASDG
ncbi:hypothetical protein BH20VER3_BH20VER3_19780 [soil metagenome]